RPTFKALEIGAKTQPTAAEGGRVTRRGPRTGLQLAWPTKTQLACLERLKTVIPLEGVSWTGSRGRLKPELQTGRARRMAGRYEGHALVPLADRQVHKLVKFHT